LFVRTTLRIFRHRQTGALRAFPLVAL
jgi:hypothetical protein